MQGILLLPPQGMLGQLKVGSRRREIAVLAVTRTTSNAIRDIARATHHPQTAVPLPLPRSLPFCPRSSSARPRSAGTRARHMPHSTPFKACHTIGKHRR